jgi:hypothetical protein
MIHTSVGLQPHCLPSATAAQARGESICLYINNLTTGRLLAFPHTAIPGGGCQLMAHTNSQNQIQHSITPMLLTWTRCISWTILLSALLAIFFALLLDGCSRIH